MTRKYIPKEGHIYTNMQQYKNFIVKSKCFAYSLHILHFFLTYNLKVKPPFTKCFSLRNEKTNDN